LLGEEDESGGMPASRSVETGTLAFGEIHVPLSRFRDPWWVELLPAGRARQFLVRRWLRKIPELAEIYRRSALSTLETAADDWVAWMDRELANRIEGMRVHVSGLLLRQPEIADLPEIESVLDRLRELVKAVLRMTPEESDGTPPTILAETTHQRPAPMRPCPICVRIERALVDFMAHFQYELSVNQGEQRRHALRSGFARSTHGSSKLSLHRRESVPVIRSC
jgi:predicted transcriptional regulator